MLAPLAGITDSSFRRLCRYQGAAMVYSEMVSAKGLYYDGKKTEELLKFYPEEAPIAYQIFGSDPDIMAWAVEKLSVMGNCMIDVNMGCPVPKVTRNGEGAALMKTPLLAAKIVKAMVKAEERSSQASGRTAKPITVKCRTGWNQDSINLEEFALRIEEAGAAALAVHGRTREQMYSGKADWNAIEKIKTKLTIPIIGNGDALSGEDAVNMLKETGCDFVMIARGALGNPWIFRNAIEIYEGRPVSPAITADEKLSMIKMHIGLLVEEKGQRCAVQEMRKHIGWYLKGIKGAAEVRREVNRAHTVEQLLRPLEILESDRQNP